MAENARSIAACHFNIIKLTHINFNCIYDKKEDGRRREVLADSK
jgi:hypothetical protein